MQFLKDISTTELVIIALLVVLLFGGKRLPELGRGLGEAAKQFRKALGDVDGNGEPKKKK